ncbi:MAG TPA: MBL fold metallo-hydrolase [Cytophagales bacterium]|nr:MBL fold metallo-hydrolase [Cytophagales bacterium]
MKNDLRQSEDSKYIPMTSFKSGKGHQVRNDIFYYTDQIVNVVFIGNPTEGPWILVDAGMPKSGNELIRVAEDRFGKGKKPLFILLTHGHFDHVGSIVDLINYWNVPVYAHIDEFPYLTGQRPYLEPDPTVEGGLLAKISSIYPYEPINIAKVLKALPADGSIPELEDWKWISTPGHSPGHVSFFRESDGTLIVGDAFVAVRQDSFYKVLIQKKELNGPPRYFTTDWQAAWNSVKLLESLNPTLAITGHGPSFEGSQLKEGLKALAMEFDQVAIPAYGKYLKTDNS